MGLCGGLAAACFGVGGVFGVLVAWETLWRVCLLSRTEICPLVRNRPRGVGMGWFLQHPEHKHLPSYGRLMLWVRQEQECGIR